MFFYSVFFLSFLTSASHGEFCDLKNVLDLLTLYLRFPFFSF